MRKPQCGRVEQNEAKYPRTCEQCKGPFMARHPRGKFCKNKCRQRAKRERERHAVLALLVQERDYRKAGKPAKAKAAFAAARKIRQNACRMW